MPKHVRGDVGMIVARPAVILQQQTDRLIGDRPPVAVAKKEILCLCMTVCHAMIRLQRPARTGASDGQQPLLLSFSADAQRVYEQVDITDAQLTELGDAHTRGEQQFKERNIAKGAHLAKRGICQVCLSVEITEKVLQSCRRDRSGKRQRFLKVRADLIERIFFDPLMEDEIGEKKHAGWRAFAGRFWGHSARAAGRDNLPKGCETPPVRSESGKTAADHSDRP